MMHGISKFIEPRMAPNREPLMSLNPAYCSEAGFELINCRAKLTEYQNRAMRIYVKGVTPKCFNWGSSSGLACGEL
jgi:hypothetical protein